MQMVLGRWDSVPVVALAGDDPVMAVRQTYWLPARREARGRSAACEALAGSVADDAVSRVSSVSLPPGKHQSDLLFGAVRYLLGAPPGIRQLRDLISQFRAELARVALACAEGSAGVAPRGWVCC